MDASMRERVVEVGMAVLSEDDVVATLLAEGVEAALRLQRAAALTREPERFSRATFEWGEWDAQFRDCLEHLGPALLKACLQRMEVAAQTEAASNLDLKPVKGASPSDDGLSLGETSSESEANPVELPVDDDAAPISSGQAMDEESCAEWVLVLDEPHGLEVIDGQVLSTDSEPEMAETSVSDDPELAFDEPQRVSVTPEAHTSLSDEAERQTFQVTHDRENVVEGVVSAGFAQDSQLASPETASRESVVTPAAMALLKSQIGQRSWSEPDRKVKVSVRTQSGLLRDLEERVEFAMECFRRGEEGSSDVFVRCIHAATADDLLQDPHLLSLPLQRAYVLMMAAMGRAFQVMHPEQQGVLDSVFARLLRFIDDERLGYVHGLARAHTPVSGSWDEDVRRHWRQLRPLLANKGAALMDVGTSKRLVEEAIDEAQSDEQLHERLKELVGQGLCMDKCVLRLLVSAQSALGGHELRNLRHKVREQVHHDEASDVREDTIIPEDWPFRKFIEGRKAVVIGSAGKGHQLQNIQEAFGFDGIQWVDSCRSIRRVQALVDSVKAGDERLFLVMHRYTSHKASNMIWDRRNDVNVIGVEKGFGVTSVRCAIEHHFDSGAQR